MKGIKKTSKAIVLATFLAGSLHPGSLLAADASTDSTVNPSTGQTTTGSTADPSVPTHAVGSTTGSTTTGTTTVQGTGSATNSTTATAPTSTTTSPAAVQGTGSASSSTTVPTASSTSVSEATNTVGSAVYNPTDLVPPGMIKHTILFDLQNKSTYVDGSPTVLETPATLVNNHLYVPLRFLSTFLGFEPNWDDKTRTITFATKTTNVTLKPDTNEAMINGQTVPFDSIATIVNNKLLLAARKMSELSGVTIDYNAATSRVTVTALQKKPLPKEVNAQPIARFSTDKKEYRMGEPIHYIDLSYDPDGTGYYPYWTGKQDAFFTPGPKEITLVIKDPDGLASESYTQTINISSQQLTSEDEYPFYFGSMNSDPKLITLNKATYDSYSTLDKTELSRDTSRKLIMSDSPEQFKESGILYQEKLSGKARLYATHENETDRMMKVSLVVTNPTSQSITLKTTQRGVPVASKIPEQQGAQALAEWYLDRGQDQVQVIQPGQSIIFYQSTPLFPQEGINILYDVESNGELQYTFVAHDPDNEDPLKFQTMKKLPRGGNVRGTFDATSIDWSIDATKMQGKPGRIVIGDPVTKPWVQGKDGMTGESTENKGNYGVFYNLEIKKPGKAAFALVPRGGAFKGTVLFKEGIYPLPESGIVPAFSGYLIGRTDGSEDTVKLQVCPPSGSSLPFDILIFPLDDRK